MEGLKILRTSLTPEAASHILETACGGSGIGYWARVPSSRRDAPGGSLEWIVVEDHEGREPLKPGTSDGAWTKPCTFKITRAKIAKAVDAILKDPHGTEAVGTAEKIMSHEFADGPTADCIVQVACHGKVLYG